MTVTVVMIFQKKILLTEPLKSEKIIIASPENLTTKKMSTRPSLYYDGNGSYNFRKKILSMKPLKEVEKKIIISRKFDNEKNEHRTKSVLCPIR